MRCFVCREPKQTLFRVLVGLAPVEKWICAACADKRRWRRVVQAQRIVQS